MWFRNLAPGKKILYNEKFIDPPESFYKLSVELNDGKFIPLKNFTGKKILLVNTASDCAYTAQYDELQKLSVHFKKQLVIIGFPTNDFKEQEKAPIRKLPNFAGRIFLLIFRWPKKARS